MENNKSYHDWLFEESEEEKEIHRQLDAEQKRYEKTEEFLKHEATLSELLAKLVEAGKRRRENAKVEARKHRVRREPKKVDMEAFKRENEERYRKKFEGYPEPLKEAITAYNKLDDAAKKVFQHDTWAYHPDYDTYQNPKTTKKDLSDLLEILVQTTIDFIDERGLDDIYSIGFGADSLQESRKFGEWTPATDADIHANGLGKIKGSDGKEYTVVQLIGEYM